MTTQTQATFTKDQLDAIMAGKRDPRFKGRKAGEIAAALQAEGHAAWKPAAPAPAAAPNPLDAIDAMDIDPGPQPGAGGVVTKIEDVRSNTAIAIVRPADLATAPADKSPRLPAAPVQGVDGLEELDASDLVLPALTLRQAQTQDVPDSLPHGYWFFKGQTQIHSAKRRIVVLHVAKTRSLMLEYQKTQRPAQIERIRSVSGVEPAIEREKPVCFSRDRVTPVVQEDIKPLAASCKDCAFGKWRTVAGKAVMDCGEGYQVLIVDRTDAGEDGPGMPAWLYLRSAQIAPTKAMLTGLKIAAHAQRQPSCAFEIELSSRSEKRPDGNYFVPVFGPPVPLASKELIELYAQTRDSALATQDHAEALA